MNQNDADRMMQMITGYWVTQVVHAAARFSIADHLAKAPATAEDIADAEGTDPSATFRLLRTCASLGLVKYDGNSRFAGTSLLATLRKDNPQSLRAIAVSWPSAGHWLPWGRFAEAVKTGKSQTVPALGAGLFEYFATNASEAAAFTESMTSLTSTIAKETATHRHEWGKHGGRYRWCWRRHASCLVAASSGPSGYRVRSSTGCRECAC